MTRRVLAPLALLVPFAAVAGASSTPSGIAQQCEKYGYVSDVELSDVGNAMDVVYDEASAVLGEAVADHEAAAAATLEGTAALVGMDGGNLLMSARLAGGDGPQFVMSHAEGPTSGGEISLGDDTSGVTIAYGETAFFTVVQDDKDAVVYVQVTSGDAVVDEAKFTWEGGGCTDDEGCSYDFGFDMVDLDHTGDGNSWGTVLSNTARANGPLVKAVKSLTGLGLKEA